MMKMSFASPSHSLMHGCSNRSNTRKSVSSDFQTPRSRLEKRGAAEFFLTNFKVFASV